MTAPISNGPTTHGYTTMRDATWGSRVLSFWGARVRVVTNVVNPRCFSCGFLLRCYERRQSEGFFAEVPVEGLCWASFFAEMLLKGLCWASSFAPIGPAPRSCRRRGARGWLRWGFCSIRSWLAVCRRRVVPLVTPFPPFGGGPAAPSAASARAPSRRTSPRRARRRSSTTTRSRRRRNMSAALDRLKQQNEPE